MPEEGGKSGAEQFNREGLTIGVDYNSQLDRKGEDEKLDKLVGWFKEGKGSPEITRDIQSERWVKVIWYVWPVPTISPLISSLFIPPEWRTASSQLRCLSGDES